MQPMHSTSSTYLCRKQGSAAFGQLAALRRLLSAPGHASGCTKLRPASGNQPFGPCCPARQANPNPNPKLSVA
eukprot:scaffold3500_cov56-Phaeocystis_antarctica.AAC.2